MAARLVWVSGGAEGIGLGLIRHVAYADARGITLSRRQHPQYESFLFDLARPETWPALAAHFERELRALRGGRAVFIHNAFLRGPTGFPGEVAADKYRDDVTANAAAPLVLGDLFLRAVLDSGYAGEAGLVLMSSAA